MNGHLASMTSAAGDPAPAMPNYLRKQLLETPNENFNPSLHIYLPAECRHPHWVRIQGSEYLGKWVNTKNPNDTFQVTRNGDEYLIIGQEQKPGVGAIYKDGALEVKGALLSAELTYVKRTDTILAPGFFGQIEYKRQE